jgi:hypothetical protein
MTTSTMSTQTTNRLKNGDVIRITAEHFPPAARDVCGARMVSADLTLEKATEIVADSIAGIARMMGASNTKLERSEYDYASEQADDPPARKKRDDANADLAQRWAEVKGHLTRRFGDTTPREYGLEGELPATPDALAKQTANAVQLLRAKPRTHTSKLGEFTTAAAADHLEEAQIALASALAAVTTESKQLQDALGLRDAAMAEWTNVYQSCATLLEGYLRLGGRTDLADRVRPTVRRASGLDLTPPAPTDPGPAQPGPTEPAPAPTPAT